VTSTPEPAFNAEMSLLAAVLAEEPIALAEVAADEIDEEVDVVAVTMNSASISYISVASAIT
jgi:hypothetical protein